MKEHIVKSETDYFSQLWRGQRAFEVRRNDRGYAVGDIIVFQEYDRVNGAYSDREERRRISFILPADTRLGLMPGYCVLGLTAVPPGLSDHWPTAETQHAAVVGHGVFYADAKDATQQMPCLYKKHIVKDADSCLVKAADDEPLFVLRAQDITAPVAIEEWCRLAERLGAPAEKVAHARLHAEAMRRWAGAKKVPD